MVSDLGAKAIALIRRQRVEWRVVTQLRGKLRYERVFNNCQPNAKSLSAERQAGLVRPFAILAYGG